MIVQISRSSCSENKPHNRAYRKHATSKYDDSRADAIWVVDVEGIEGLVDVSGKYNLILSRGSYVIDGTRNPSVEIYDAWRE